MGRVMEQQLIEFPTSAALTHVFGLGSVLGTYFAVLVASGLVLSLGYVPLDTHAFTSVMAIVNEATLGYLVYITHSVGAGVVFLLLYLHMGKAFLVRSWSIYALLTGSVILILVVVSAFLGYVLLWQLMSYWAATVITTLLSVLPNGGEVLTSLWGDYTLNGVTLTRFYSFHYLATLLTAAVAIIHLVALHLLGSTPHYVAHDTPDTIPFARYYMVKDAILFAIVYLAWVDVLLCMPTLFGDAELAIHVNTMATPPHIVPEWYLLGYYATLRGIPSKALGIVTVALVLVSLYLACAPALAPVHY